MDPNRRRRIPVVAVLLAITASRQSAYSFVPVHVSPAQHPSTYRRKRARWQVGANMAPRREPDLDDQNIGDADHHQITSSSPIELSRRSLLLNGALLAATSAIPLPAMAGKPELDKTGELYSPKATMLRGGSDAARGINQRESASQPRKLQPGQSIQNVYETRFMAYLTRFLLTFDPAAHAWWVQQGFQDSWEQELKPAEYDDEQNAKFAEFAESVEVGLADYFVGPYGSYASVSAAKAGLLASAPAASARPKDDWQGKSLWGKLGFVKDEVKQSKRVTGDNISLEKQGILNLYALLKARYTTEAEKRQLAILFSFIADPDLQPSAEIRGLLGEADNANVTKIELKKSSVMENEADSRTSSRRGGGYSIDAPPKVEIEPPPALGDEFKAASCSPIMRPTSRILRINVTDGGEGYRSAPAVTVRQAGARRQCDACAILDRSGHVESIIVLNPGFGYGQIGKGYIPPQVYIEPPDMPQKLPSSQKKLFRRAKAVAELEYEIIGVNLVHGGNGYVATEPPKVTIPPPADDPDWYVSSEKSYGKRGSELVQEDSYPVARVSEMALPDGSPVTSIENTEVTRGLIDRLRREPLELLPSSTRPEPVELMEKIYTIPSLPPPPPFLSVPSPRYRAFDPIFGGIGSVPVQKGATELKASEYARLALSGAVCTVIVRTALNPLELVKTKIQLENDDELNDYAYKFAKARASHPEFTGLPQESDADQAAVSPSSGESAVSQNGTIALATVEKVEVAEAKATAKKKVKLGTMDMIKAIVELRGPFALFQSADITFLASLMFGSFGFGATELFRRSFTAVFFNEDSGDGLAEIVLLAAAALATVVTAAAASPFEVLRVRSMGLVEAKPWKDVLEDFLEDNSSGGRQSKDDDESEFRLQDLKPVDVLPLWKGFAPTVSRELPFAVTKFLVFDIIANTIVAFLNGQAGEGALPIQVGVGGTGLAISAASGAIAGIAGAFVSHPADLILTLTSSAAKKSGDDEKKPDWKDIVQELLQKEGGIANLFTGLPARSVFFFLVIGLQFFLYDYVKTLFQVGSDDLSLVLDVFYAVRQGLVS